MNGSPAVCWENLVHRWHSTHRSRSSSTLVDTATGLGKVRLRSWKRESARPLLIAWFCSGHSPPLSQTGQSSGWLISSSSMTPCWALSATTEVSYVLTTMPGITVVVQEAAGLGMPRPLPMSETSTRHCRHAPAGSSSGWSQKRGIEMPSCSAARMSRVPFGTEISMPSMVTVTRSSLAGASVTRHPPPPALSGQFGPEWPPRIGHSGRKWPLDGDDGGGGGRASVRSDQDVGCPERTTSSGYVGEVFVPEVLDRGRHAAGRAVAECAEGAAEDVVGEVEQRLEVLLGALAPLQPVVDADVPIRPLAAGRALAARLVLEALGPLLRRPHDAVVLVEDLDGGVAVHRAGLDHRVEVEREIEVLGGEQRTGRAARRPELELLAAAHPAGELQQFAQRGAHGRLVLPGVLHPPGQREDRCAGRAFRSERLVPVGAAQHDVRDAGERADVVDHRRRVVEAVGRRERRLEPRLTAPALERVEQRGLLAADVGAGATVHDDVAGEAAVQDVLAEVAPGARLVHRADHAADRVHRLAADVDERPFGAHREAGDDDALDHRVRVVHHQWQVAAGAWFALVGVHDDVLGLRVVLRDELPLHPGREAGATTAAEVGVLDHRDDLGRLHAQRLAQAGVAVQPFVVVDLPGLVGAEPLGQDRGQGHFASSPAGLAGCASSEPEVFSGASCWLVGCCLAAALRALGGLVCCRFPSGCSSTAYDGAVSPRSMASLTPISVGTPLPFASKASACSSCRPAICRSICLTVHSGAPRVGSGRSPGRNWLTKLRAVSTVWLSKNS